MRNKFILPLFFFTTLVFIPFLTLAQETVQIDPVVVTATRQEEEVLRIPSHITVITREDIENSRAANAGDLLRAESGLWVTNTSGSTPTGIFIDARGFNNGTGNGGRLLVLIDGRRANLADSSSPDWAVIPVGTIERIEIVRGSATALYGDNAMAGVINIITKKGSEEPSVTLSADYRYYDCWMEKTGSDRINENCWNRRADLSGTKGSLSYYLYGGFDSMEGYRDASDYKSSNYAGNLSYKTSDFSTFTLRGSYLSNERELPGSLTSAEIDLLGREGSIQDDTGGTRQYQFEGVFDSFISETQWYELSASQLNRSGSSVVTLEGIGVSDLNSNIRSTGVSGKYRIIAKAGNVENRSIIGLDLLKETVNVIRSFEDTASGLVFPGDTDYERKLFGAYAHNEVSLTPSFIVTQAIRYDWTDFDFDDRITGDSVDRSFIIWSPKVGATYLLSETYSVFASWSEGFRLPNQDELVGVIFDAPELDPEEATTYEIGGQIRAGRFLEGTVSVYRMDVKDEIFFIPPDVGDFEFGENINVPEVKHEGIEASASLRLSETLKIKGNYTFTKTEIVEGPFEGNDLPITPRHAGGLIIHWGEMSGWMLSSTGRFVDERILANDLANVQDKLHGYSVFDTVLHYRTETYDFFLGINNILNKEYEDFGGVGGFPFGDRIGFNPAPGRNGVAGITVHL